ncbi:MAG: hypothetical protein GF355_15010 [Candidatus Eisenbacteria bacterium]|nr:hypothetical protein [Candidatus Eisenbacteria bacterium]
MKRNDHHKGHPRPTPKRKISETILDFAGPYLDLLPALAPTQFSTLNESHIDSVDVTKPIVLAEISPGNYNLIDGHHRLARARRLGMRSLRAYKLKVHEHIGFLTSKEAYLEYVEYWNSKQKAAQKRRSAKR